MHNEHLLTNQDVRVIVETTLVRGSSEKDGYRTILEELCDNTLPQNEQTVKRYMEEGSFQ